MLDTTIHKIKKKLEQRGDLTLKELPHAKTGEPREIIEAPDRVTGSCINPESFIDNVYYLPTYLKTI